MQRRAFEMVIFDMDGTLTRPAIDFAAMRRDLKLGPGDISRLVLAMPAAEQPAAWAVIEAYEEDAMRRQELQAGTADLLAACRRHGIRLGLVTRNAPRSVEHLCARFGLAFDAVVTRDFPVMKPHPDTILHALGQCAMAPGRALMVGDYVDDLHCGRAAGTATCFFHNAGHRDYSAEADYTVRSMTELGAIVLGAEVRSCMQAV